jgi:kinesin family protein 2/24
LPHILAPRESGAQLLKLSSTAFEYRCQKCPRVKLEQAKAFRLKLWQMHIDSQHNSVSSKTVASSKQPNSADDSVPSLGAIVSSQELDPACAKLPFKDRLRPGMVVSYNVSQERGAASNALDGFELAVLLCPADASCGSTKEATANATRFGRINKRGNGVADGERYLCALMVPGQTDDAYELSLWQQIVVDVNSMDTEVQMEYDSATRYYYVLV